MPSTPRPARLEARARPLGVAVAAVAAVAALGGCSGSSAPAADAGARSTGRPSASPTPQATVPSGWTTRTLDGLQVAFPPEFQVRTDAQGVSLQVGVPFTGQPFPPPQLQVFVEKDPVGTLAVREPLTRAQIDQQLGGVDIPPSTRTRVAGATDAVQFTYTYRTQAATSVLDTPLEATDMRQSDLLIEVPGLPKYGLRYSAPADQYDASLWRQVIAALAVESSRRAR